MPKRQKELLKTNLFNSLQENQMDIAFVFGSQTFAYLFITSSFALCRTFN